VEHRFSDTFIPKYSAMDEKIGKKDQQDDQGSEVEREALWKKKGLVDIRKGDEDEGRKEVNPVLSYLSADYSVNLTILPLAGLPSPARNERRP
jgi:hypothetical protein